MQTSSRYCNAGSRRAGMRRGAIHNHSRKGVGLEHAGGNDICRNISAILLDSRYRCLRRDGRNNTTRINCQVMNESAAGNIHLASAHSTFTQASAGADVDIVVIIRTTPLHIRHQTAVIYPEPAAPRHANDMPAADRQLAFEHADAICSPPGKDSHIAHHPASTADGGAVSPAAAVDNHGAAQHGGAVGSTAAVYLQKAIAVHYTCPLHKTIYFIDLGDGQVGRCHSACDGRHVRYTSCSESCQADDHKKERLFP